MTLPNLSTSARLGFLEDEEKEIHNYMGQHEASCNCEQNVPEWTSYHDSRWNDVATPVSCLCLPLQLLLSNLPGSHPRQS